MKAYFLLSFLVFIALVGCLNAGFQYGYEEGLKDLRSVVMKETLIIDPDEPNYLFTDVTPDMVSHAPAYLEL